MLFKSVTSLSLMVYFVVYSELYASVLCQISKTFKQQEYDNSKNSHQQRSNVWHIYKCIACISEYTPERTEVPVSFSVNENQILYSLVYRSDAQKNVPQTSFPLLTSQSIFISYCPLMVQTP